MAGKVVTVKFCNPLKIRSCLIRTVHEFCHYSCNLALIIIYIMKQLFIQALFYLLIFILSGCNNFSSEESVIGKTEEITDAMFKEDKSLIEESKNYLQNRDFDGDKIDDYLSFNYTGGAHCCYKMILKLSSEKDTIEYPFEMDGGYEFGIVDGSQHDKFNIDDYDKDGLPEIFMEISTYNGEKYSIDTEWTIKYGIKSNDIIFNYSNGKIVIEDYDEKKHIKKSKQN